MAPPGRGKMEAGPMKERIDGVKKKMGDNMMEVDGFMLRFFCRLGGRPLPPTHGVKLANAWLAKIWGVKLANAWLTKIWLP